MKIFIILTFICWLRNGATEERKTGCISDTSRHCGTECASLATTSEETCIYSTIDRNGCDNYCNQYRCSSEAKCVCTCSLPVWCTVTDLNNYVWDTNSCAITELERVDEEIEEQMEYNVLQVASGVIPGAGTLFDFAFAMYDPNSHITSPFALVNQVRDDMNAAIIELQRCMDDKISNLKVESVLEQQKSMITQYYEVSLANGDTQCDAIDSLLFNWNENLMTIFGSLENNLLEYLGMLPAYQALYPLYALLATERVYCLIEDLDYDNIEYIATTVRARFDMFDQWLLDARINYIYPKVLQKMSENCEHDDAWSKPISAWFLIFHERYLFPLRNYAQTFDDLINYIAPTTTTTPTTTDTPITLGEKCTTTTQCAGQLYCSSEYEYTTKGANPFMSYLETSSSKVCCNADRNLKEYDSCSCVAECAGAPTLQYAWNGSSSKMSCCNGKCRYYKKISFFTSTSYVCPSEDSDFI